MLFVIDARAGLTPGDRHFAQWLRRQGRPVLLVANKAEGRSASAATLEAYELGLGDPVAVSAEHGEGVADLMSEIAARLPEPEEAAEEAAHPLKLAIVGRPNAGKSTLLNRLVGEERMVTGPEPGLTRDAVTVLLADAEGPIELVDTAGLRRRARIEESLEKLSVGAAIGALKMAEVVVLAVDGTEGLHDQDLQIAQLIAREGRACVLVLTKWDAVADRTVARRAVAERLEESLAQVKGLPVVTLSALTGAGMARLLPAVRAGACGVEHARADRGAEPLVRAGAVAPSAADDGARADQAALHHPGQGAPAHLHRVRHAGGGAAGRLPALPDERDPRAFPAARHADPAADARDEESLRRGIATGACAPPGRVGLAPSPSRHDPAIHP